MNTKPKPEGYRASRRRPRRSGSGKAEPILLRGDWKAELIRDGRVIDVREQKNLIVDGGLDFVKELLLDSVSPTTLSTLTNIAIGTDGTTPVAGDTALLAQVATQVFDNYGSGAAGIATVDVTFAAGTGTGNIAEAGMLDAALTLFNRVIFSPAIPKTITDALKITFTLTAANA